jgi:predicted nuclease of predicted toxin-antitoxin system
VNFLVDNQLPPALARFIESELKAAAIHVADVGLRDASDADVWRYASAKGLILISKDEDFANMIINRPTTKLIWVRVGNCRRLFLLDLFLRMWPRIFERLESGDSLIEIR